MNRVLLLLLAALPVAAHMVSMSSSELRINGTRGQFDLRMPLYEVTHIQAAERSIFENIRFTGGGGLARLLERRCREDAGDSALICSGTYEFPGTVDQLDAEVQLYAITVPNHVHVLRVVNGSKTDQAVFDASFSKATIAFRPPTTVETLAAEFGSGLVRGAGLAQVLFLVALVLAARSRRELLEITAAFGGAVLAVAAILPRVAWEPAPRFVEAASALTIAYLAVEILLLPKAGRRWLVVAALGLFHGFYFAVFLKTSGYHAGFFLPGVLVAELALIALFTLAAGWLERRLPALRPVRSASVVLLVIGLGWFVLRLRS